MSSGGRALSTGRKSPSAQVARIQLLRLIERVDGRLQRLVRIAQISEEGLHDLHRELRRIRAWLRPWRGLPRPGERELYRAIDRDLQAFSRACGELRDFDVAGSLLLHGLRGVKKDLLRSPRIALAAEARRGRKRLRKLAKILLGGHRLPALASLLARGPTARLQPKWASNLSRVRHRLQLRAGSALRRVRRHATVAALHQLRKCVRSLRLLDESGRQDRGGAPRPALHRLVARIGELHDLDLLLRRISSRKGFNADYSWSRKLSELRSLAKRKAITCLDDPGVLREMQSLTRTRRT
jgi:CHAD domain-containing protein